jgi:anaerobic selenocysteine-containing dehydrogenase
MGLVQGEGMAARFFHRLGAAQLDRTICAAAGGEALVQTLGGKVGMKVEFFAESKLILIWGSNSIASNLHFWRQVQQAKRDGARIVCIDPRRTETADKCHEHIALRPGTDGALALALMHELVRNDWLDTITSPPTRWAGRRFASARCNGRLSARRRSAASRCSRSLRWRATMALWALPPSA